MSSSVPPDAGAPGSREDPPPEPPREHEPPDAFGTSLEAALGGRYAIVREIGRGGMACVYLARDRKHSRDVAIKVIRPDLAATLGRARFLREIDIAARLRHPNIVPLYDSGDAAGVLYFVMPFEHGSSLSERLRQGPVPLAEAVSVLRDVARALAYAHDEGVVHRDIKPDNVLLSDGAAVVTDFGIAKALDAAQTGGAGTSATGTGFGLGTPDYIAPEQAVGDPRTDARADIYSFGCLAYELLAGKPPFHGLPSHGVIAAHIGTTPVPLGQVVAGVPEALASLVARCLEKDPAKRPQSAREMLDVLVRLPSGNEGAVRPGPRLRPVLVATALAALAALAAVAWAVLGRPAPAAASTVAVLPLRPLAGDSLLAEGVSEQVAIGLGKLPWLQIKSLQGVGNYRGQQEVDVREAGRALGVRYLVTGSLRESQGRLVANVLLIDAQDSRQLWAEHFDRGTVELEALCEGIAHAIGDTLRVIISPGVDVAAVPARAARHVSGEAFRLYVLGQRQLYRRGLRVKASADNFRGALALDTLYAEAYAGLSVALALSPYFEGVTASEVYEEVRSAAETAIRLDATLSQPHIALGLIYWHDLQWARARSEFETAVRLNPHDIDAHVQLGRYHMSLGRFSDAMSQLALARADDPASAMVSGWTAYDHLLQGHLDSAVAESRRALQSDSMNLPALGLGSLILLKRQRNDEALALANRVPGFPPGSYVMGAAGDRSVMLARAEALERMRPEPSLGETTRTYLLLGLGDTARALDALERATARREIWPSYLGGVFDPLFDPVRRTPRFQAIARGLRIPAADHLADGRQHLDDRPAAAAPADLARSTSAAGSRRVADRDAHAGRCGLTRRCS